LQRACDKLVENRPVRVRSLSAALRGLTSSAVVLALVASTQPAHADGPRGTERSALPASAGPRTTSSSATPEPSAEARQQAKQRYEEGVEAYQAGLYELSIEYFNAADRLAPSAALSFNIGRAYEKLGERQRAVAAYRDYLERAPASQHSMLARSRIAALTEPEEPAPESEQAAAAAEGKSSGSEGVAGEKAPASFAGEGSATRTAVSTSDGLGAWPLVAMSAGGVALVSAGVFELMRRDAQGEVNDARRDPDHSQVDLAAHMDTAESRQSAAQVSFGIGAALLVTGGVMLLVDDRMTRSPKTSAGVSVAPGSFAASMTTRF
jgi:tetratricopeptide (TPR) repeat protein